MLMDVAADTINVPDYVEKAVKKLRADLKFK